MVKVNTPPETSPPAPRAGADLQTDSSDLGAIELPVWVADISTPGEGGSNKLEEVADGTPTGYKEGTQAKAPDAGMTRGVRGANVRGYVRDNARKHDMEPSQMDPVEVLAGFVRAGDALADMLTRGAFEAGSLTEVVAFADRAGEPSMAELWPDSKRDGEMMASLVNRASARVRDISKGPGKKAP